MAENNNSRGLGEVTIKLDIDVSEALTGLKALQREAKNATKALRDVENASTKEFDLERAISEILANSESYVHEFGEDVSVNITYSSADGRSGGTQSLRNRRILILEDESE